MKRCAIFWTWMLACCLSSQAQQVDAPADSADAMIELMPADGTWLPGAWYRSGGGWLGLACQGARCRLVPARLSVRAEARKSDDGPQPGQRLRFSTESRQQGQVLAWMRRQRGVTWQAPGEVSTMAAVTQGFERPDTPGALEIRLMHPKQGEMRLVPMFDQAHGEYELQLRTRTQRQTLDVWQSCSPDVAPDYLLWAGDVDRDGQADFLIRGLADPGRTVLFLSSRAQADELVGFAGHHVHGEGPQECGADAWMRQGRPAGEP